MDIDLIFRIALAIVVVGIGIKIVQKIQYHSDNI